MYYLHKDHLKIFKILKKIKFKGVLIKIVAENYSYLKATIGSNFEALNAGYNPAANPTNEQTKKAKQNEKKLIQNFIIFIIRTISNLITIELRTTMQ